jgi:hypothetical protein
MRRLSCYEVVPKASSVQDNRPKTISVTGLLFSYRVTLVLVSDVACFHSVSKQELWMYGLFYPHGLHVLSS